MDIILMAFHAKLVMMIQIYHGVKKVVTLKVMQVPIWYVI